MKRLILMVSICTALFGCAGSPYQPYKDCCPSGGYRDSHIKDNVYFVNFWGNGYTDPVDVTKYFHRRAKEVCVEAGYSDYKIISDKDVSTYSGVGGGTVSGGVVSVNTAQIRLPSREGYVECIKKK